MFLGCLVRRLSKSLSEKSSCDLDYGSDGRVFAAIDADIRHYQKALTSNIFTIDLCAIPLLLYPIFSWVFIGVFRFSDPPAEGNSKAIPQASASTAKDRSPSCPDGVGVRKFHASVSDYQSLLERAISRLEWNHTEAREELYERARLALRSAQFASDKQRKDNASRLEQAIRIVELRSPKRFDPKASTYLLLISILFLPQLWTIDFTCMSLYWIGRPRKFS
jgi:hypothetical protein